MIPYGRQSVDEKDVAAVCSVLRSDWLTQGPKIKQFEELLAEYCGAEYCVVFNSGTSALHAAYFTAGLNKDDEFVTSPVSFVATANAGLYLGAQPVFADIEKDTGNIDISKINEKITEKTKLIVPVHYSGHPADMEAIYNMARKRGISVIEDACHALGAKYKGEMTGGCKHSDMAVFSFHPVKHIATGEGGAVTTNSKEYYEKLLMFRSHGITKEKPTGISDGDWFYEMHFLGYNYRMTDIQAALGVSQMKTLGRFVERRREIAEAYNDNFNGNPYFDLLPEKDYAYSSYHLYPIRLNGEYKGRKKEIFAALRENGLGVQVHYIPIYLQPFYQSLGYRKGSCIYAESFYEREISIPMYPALSDRDIERIVDNIFRVFKGFE
ncbi:MAG: UDP-4-amino-4,6-dideoxy-N-acetyl-beta-L-altrosamine transaminase [Candidatus Scalindua sp.]